MTATPHIAKTETLFDHHPLGQRFSDKALKAGRWALGFVHAHSDRPHTIFERRSTFLQALISSCVYGGDHQLSVDLALALNDMMLRGGLWSEWEPYLKQVLHLVDQNENSAATFHLCLALSETQALRGNWLEALPGLEKAMRLELYGGDDWFCPFGRYAECQLYLGHPADAKSTLKTAMEKARQCEDHRAQIVLTGQLGRLYRPQGEWEQAIQCFEESLRLARAVDWPEQILSNLNFLGAAYLETSRPESALLYLDEALLFANQLNERSGIGVVLSNIGLAYLEMGNLDEAETAFCEAIAIQRELKHPVKLVVSLTNLGQLAIACEDFEAAKCFIDEALMLVDTSNIHFTQARVYRVLGDLYSKTGRIDAAQTAYDHSKQHYLAVGDIYRASKMP